MCAYIKKYCCLFLVLPVFLYGCDATEHPFMDAVQKREILIYCGTTMLDPIMEIAAIVEKEKNCVVKISYGGSGHLKKSIEVNKLGDLFLPGSASYLNSLQEKGVVVDTVDVGFMEVALFVSRGNPKSVQADIAELLRPDLRVVIGTDTSGSIGKESRIRLEKQSIYNEVLKKAIYLTTDSKGLVRALRNGDADLVLNWRAVAYTKDNKLYMDEIRLPVDQVDKKKLTIGLLASSKNPELATYFMDFAASTLGQEIFERYGL